MCFVSPETASRRTSGWVCGVDAVHDLDTYLDHMAHVAHVQWTPEMRFILDDRSGRLVNRSTGLWALPSMQVRFDGI